ncbi:NAD-dependent epimerase/dehydratase family protein [Aliikangiella sp. IMCC44359]|uniref:NAD-dependent epimerase/dehydratase family protein n=1 Tax=Aliikangiella sp. IMCC44359 TaxID=3459125 RepID=UPI00403B17B9
MKVFLTGSTGFLGLNILNALIKKGHEPHLYIRESSDTTYVNRFNATIHKGELSDLETLKRAMNGMDAVIHTAGNTSCFNRDYNLLHQVNALGTKNIVDAAIANKVSSIVYTSTTSTVGAQNDKNKRADEKTILTGFRANSPYAITKQMAEKEILRAHKAGIKSIILNPAEIIGAYDHNLQWGRLVLAVYHNQVPFLPPGGGSFCSAEDVAMAHVEAITNGVSGERYILAGDDRDFISLLNIIAQKTGKSFDKPTSNYRALYLKQWCKEKFYPLLGKDYLVEPYRIKVFGGHYFFDDKKAAKFLNYQSVNLESMLTDSIDWYRQNNFIS